MIPHGVEVFVALEPIDMRLGFDRLAGLAEERVGRNARSGAMFVFFGKRRTAMKVLFFDGTGLCVFHKRMDRRVFCVPEAMNDTGVVVLEERALEDLLEGIDVERTPPRRARSTRARTH